MERKRASRSTASGRNATVPSIACRELMTTPHLKQIILALKTSAFFKNIAIVMSGTAAAQLIGFALTPIISRLFTPADFGVMGTFTSVAGIVASGVTLEYSQALMLPKAHSDAFSLFCVSCISTLAISVLCSIVVFFFPETINSVLKTTGAYSLFLLIVAILVSGLNRSCQSWCVRIKSFKVRSGSQIVRSISSNGSQIGFGYLNGGSLSLILSSVIADFLATIWLIRCSLQEFPLNIQLISFSRLKQLAREYSDFPVYSASQNVINSLSSGMPVLLLTHFYGIDIGGAYAFGMRILQVPMGFVLGALRQVLFQKAGETLHQGGKLYPLFYTTSAGLFAIALLPTLILVVWAEPIFQLIFGDSWITAGEFSQSLIVWLMFAFCNLPAILFAQLIRYQRAVFIYDLVLLAARSVSLVLGGFLLNASQTIVLFSIVGAFMNGTLIFLVGRAIKNNEKKIPG